MHLSGRSLKLPNLRNLVHDSWTAFTTLPKQDQLGIVIILAFAMLGPLLDLGGWDFFQAFRRDTLSGNYGFKTWHPYPIYWLIYPFAILPPKIGFLVWNLASAVCFVIAIRLWNGRYLNFALSLPLFWMFYAGQIDGFIALGLALAVLANPYVAGVGLVLLTIKPQVGFLPILFVLFHRRDWRMLVVPSIVFVLSLAQWGWWIPEWIASILEIEKADEVTNITLYPYSLVLLPLLWFKRSSLNVYYLVGSLLAPYYAVYSLVSLFCRYFPVWVNLLIWAMYLSLIWVDYLSGFLIPVALLLYLLFFEPEKMREGMPNTLTD